MKKLLQTTVIFIMLICGAFVSAEALPPSSRTVYAIIAADTDSNLSTTVTKDVKNILLLLDVLEKSGVSIQRTMLTGDDLTIDGITASLDGLTSVTPNDLIFFYFSGHGSRPRGEKSPWPFLDIPPYATNPSLQKIQRNLLSKNARLVISLTDCCNKHVEPKNILFFSKEHFATSKAVAQRVSRLFNHFQGKAFITAARRGQFATGTNRYGGVMTTLMMRYIDEFSGEKITWQKVVRYITKKGKPYHQTPYFQIGPVET